jgi:MHS family proline/betaine transporter-like MFS transporter
VAQTREKRDRARACGSASLINTIVAGVINSTLPMRFGQPSDRLGRLKAMWTFALLGPAMIYPMFLWLIASPSVSNLLACQAMVALMMRGIHYDDLPDMLTDLFHAWRRTTGVSLAYVLRQLLFVGVTPLVKGWIVATTGDPTSPDWHLTAILVVSLIARCRPGVR